MIWHTSLSLALCFTGFGHLLHLAVVTFFMPLVHNTCLVSWVLSGPTWFFSTEICCFYLQFFFTITNLQMFTVYKLLSTSSLVISLHLCAFLMHCLVYIGFTSSTVSGCLLHCIFYRSVFAANNLLNSCDRFCSFLCILLFFAVV